MDAAEFSSVDRDGGPFAHGIDGDCDSPLSIFCMLDRFVSFVHIAGGIQRFAGTKAQNDNKWYDADLRFSLLSYEFGRFLPSNFKIESPDRRSTSVL